jgi:hypothetical protein
VIANQRHRSALLQPEELRLRKTIQPLEALVATDLGIAGFGHDAHQFDDITTFLQQRKTPLQQRKTPVKLLFTSNF